MNQELLSEVSRHIVRGDDVTVRRRLNGQSRIKVKYGPMKIMTKRFEADPETFEEVKKLLRN